MLNKKNAAYAVFGFALVGCNNILGACDCCKSVPKELEKFTLIFKNLKGFTYEKMKDFFNKDNGKDEISGKDLVEKNFVEDGHVLTNTSDFFIVNIDDKKNEIKVYDGDKEGDLTNNHKGKNYTLVKIKFKAKEGSVKNIAKAEDKKFIVEDVEFEEKTVANG